MDTDQMVGDPDSDAAAVETRPRRRADAQRNTDAIIAAARDLLRHGALPSMSEVAAAAGVGRVTLYAHFASREALLDSVVRQAITDTDQALAALALDDDPVETAVHRLVRTSWSVLDRHRTIRGVALTELGPEALRDQHDPVVHHVESLIARGRDDGVFRTDLPHPWLVAAFYATLLLEQGVHVRAIQRILGHSDVRTTEAYTHVGDQVTRDAARRMGAARWGE